MKGIDSLMVRSRHTALACTGGRRAAFAWVAAGMLLSGSLPQAFAQPYEGYNLFTPIRSTETYLMDNSGNTVHTWSSGYTAGNSVYLLEDGTLLRAANTGDTTFNVGGAGGRVERYDWDGALQWSYNYTTSQMRQHHDVEYLPNANILMIAWELKTQAEAIAAGRNPSLLSDGELWPDHIVEIAPSGTSGGTIVWEWHLWDHLVQEYDPTNANYGAVADHPELVDLNYTMGGPQGTGADWNHVNSVAYNEELDQIVLSVHNFSEIWVIDHSTTTAEAEGHTGGNSGMGGDLLYRWGNPQTYGVGAPGDQQLFVQHDAEWIADGLPGAGNILIFNNGRGRSGGNYSSIDEIVPPLAPDGTYSNASAYGPAVPVWSYSAISPTNFYAERISGSQRLPNGNTLICDGPAGRFFEVSTAGTTVWEHDCGSEVFRVERHGTDYPGFDGTVLDDDGTTTTTAVTSTTTATAATTTAARTTTTTAAVVTTTSHTTTTAAPTAYVVVDTGQDACYSDSAAIAAPDPGAAFAGQDAQYDGSQPSYVTGKDELTVYDRNTGLTWQQSPDTDEDGDIDANDKMTWAELQTYPATLNAANHAGHNDWRLPSIKALYSLMDFRGTDPPPMGTDTTGLIPYIDTNYFAFAYGDTGAGERIIDSQWASDTLYVANNGMLFGVNFADGRIKGYGLSIMGGDKTFFVICCRGNTSYGDNRFVDNGNGTVSDLATDLMWQQGDSGDGMNWEDTLAYAGTLELGGYRDWRLPNAKELQSILDYTRSPDTTSSAAIDPLFACTSITNLAEALDYPFYWSSTTHLRGDGSAAAAAYLAFGRGLGEMQSTIVDVHGAGCQRSDPKDGNPNDYPRSGQGPQGDVQRVFNYVRCVRAGATEPTTDSDGDGLTDWYEWNYAGSTTGMVATADDDGDGASNENEEAAGTIPTDPDSTFRITDVSATASTAVVTWSSELGKTYTLKRSTNLLTDAFSTILASGIRATTPVNSHTSSPCPTAAAYRVAVE
ncbi:DUF1566 domain-containing protein [Verrucomicrobiota bacterium]